MFLFSSSCISFSTEVTLYRSSWNLWAGTCEISSGWHAGFIHSLVPSYINHLTHIHACTHAHTHTYTHFNSICFISDYNSLLIGYILDVTFNKMYLMVDVRLTLSSLVTQYNLTHHNTCYKLLIKPTEDWTNSSNSVTNCYSLLQVASQVHT